MRSRRRIAWIAAISVGVLLSLGTAGYFWAMHSLSSGVSKLDLEPLGVIFKKAASDVLVAKRESKPATLSQGFIELYQRNPGAFRADAKLFDAWVSATQIGRSTLKSTRSGSWVRSTADAGYLSPDRRGDPWNHFVCLLRRKDTLLVISAGPRAPSSPVCEDIQVGEGELSQLPRSKLLETPSGNLILVLDHKLSAATAPPS
jgi:hypothetical protein